MNKLLSYIALALILVSCGNSGGQFRLEAQFKNLNQGEFYLYNIEQGTIDTISAKDGRLTYISALRDTLTLSLLFPNFSEVPIFASPGATVKIKGDVSHLKETEVKGTKDNELMTAFRLRTSDQMPLDVVSEAEQLILQHPASPVAVYLLRRYFLLSTGPDYAKAYQLSDSLLKAQPTNVALVRMHRQLKALNNRRDSGKLPHFKAVSTKGDTITDRRLDKTANVLVFWTSYDYETQTMLRQLHKLTKAKPKDIAVVSICMDATPDEGRTFLERDSIAWPNICDGRMWQSDLVKKFGVATIGDNIVADRKGRIIGRNLSTEDLRKKVDELTKQETEN